MRAATAAGVGMIVGLGMGCGGAPRDGQTAAAPTAAIAQPPGAEPPAGYCMTIEHGRVLTEFAADDQAATICTDFSLEAFGEQIEQHGKASLDPRCAAVDLATGLWRHAAPLPKQRPRSGAPHGPLEVKQDATGVQLCTASACTTLAVPPPQGKADGYEVLVDDAGRHAMVSGRSTHGVWFFDAISGRKLGELEVDEHACLEDIEFLGDLVYGGFGPATDARGCDGPSDQGMLYRATGQPIGPLPGIRPGEATAVALGAGRYAIPDREGAAVAIVDASTAKVTTVDLPRVSCKDCSPLGAVDDWSAVGTAARSRGKLVAVSPAVLAVIDPVTGAIEKQIRYPLCPKR
jgi:hypothetical protein